MVIVESIIEFARLSHKPEQVAVLWSGGKDSTTLLYIINRMYGKIPFTVVHGDLNFYDHILDSFIRKVANHIGFSYLREPIFKNVTAKELVQKGNINKLNIMLNTAYTKSMKRLIKEKHIKAFIFGNRYQESERNNAFVKKEKGVVNYFPLLQMTDSDMWNYIYKYKIPFLNMYKKGMRQTGPIMYINKPKLINHVVSYIIHTWLRLRILFN